VGSYLTATEFVSGVKVTRWRGERRWRGKRRKGSNDQERISGGAPVRVKKVEKDQPITGAEDITAETHRLNEFVWIPLA